MKLGAFRPKTVAETDFGRNVPLPMTVDRPTLSDNWSSVHLYLSQHGVTVIDDRLSPNSVLYQVSVLVRRLHRMAC